MKKAEEIYKNLNIFAGMQATSKQIKPLNSIKLDKIERDKQRERTAGKAWGMMPKVELTDEVKNDLKALKYRNQIFAKRFYKNNDSDKLPTYFAIGTVVDDNGVRGKTERLTKKERKRSLAQQFLMDDEAQGFSKKKYENLNDRRRRMGEKKKELKMRKFSKKNGFKQK